MLTAHLAKIDAMPEATDSDRENRVLENLRGLKALKGKA
jgi:chorismate mutase